MRHAYIGCRLAASLGSREIVGSGGRKSHSPAGFGFDHRYYRSIRREILIYNGQPRGHFGSTTVSPGTGSKCRRLNVATWLPRSRAVAATIRS